MIGLVQVVKTRLIYKDQIEHEPVNILPEKIKSDLIITILSCRHYENSRQTWIRDTWLKNLPANVKPLFIVAKQQGELGLVKDDTLFIKAGSHKFYSDGPGGAPWKVYASLKWLFHNSECNHFFMVDDDTYVVVDRLLNCRYQEFDYIGRRTWNNDGAYGGPGFFLSRKAVEAIITNPFKRDTRFGDTYAWHRLRDSGFHLIRDPRFLKKLRHGMPTKDNEVIAVHQLRTPEPFYEIHEQQLTHTIHWDTMKDMVNNFAHPEIDHVRLQNIGCALKNSLLDPANKGDTVEIGTFMGMTGAFMQSIKDNWDKRPVYLYDSFQGDPPPTEDDKTREGRFTFQKGDFRAYRDEVEYNFKTRNLTNPIIVEGWIQDTYQSLPSNIGFAHIDVDFYQGTAFALEKVYERMPQKGVIIVDDYGWVGLPGTTKAVNEFVARHENLFLEELWAGKYGQCMIYKEF